jgi:transposase InsO family protein
MHRVAQESAPVPWKETYPVEQKFKFVLECERGEMTMTALCRAFGVTRQTGYKWLRRYREDPGEPSSLEDRSRRPFANPRQTGSYVEDAIVVARRRMPTWGPRKLRAWLSEKMPDVTWPAASTIGDLLKRRGLTRARRRRRHTPPSTQPFAECTAPNQLWCIDFKGWFRLGNGVRCYPLTLTDAFSRMLLRCEGLLDPDGEAVREVMESAFREYGLPNAIRSDNGPPFATVGPGGLSDLSVWWIRLGIRHERIEPGKPQQNGRHERMHLTLKQDTASPPAEALYSQQRLFDLFRKMFNHERPHEALEMKPPASVYAPSTNRFPERLPPVQIDFDVEQSVVDRNGYARCGRGRVQVGRALRYQTINFASMGDRKWQVTFGGVLLGMFDETRRQLGLIRDTKDRRRKNSAPPTIDRL